MITHEMLDNWFTYHAPNPEANWPANDSLLSQAERYEALRMAAYSFARTIVELTPTSADQTVAVRKVREAAIACDGR